MLGLRERSVSVSGGAGEDPLVEEFRHQIEDFGGRLEEFGGRLEDLEETVEGDDLGRWKGLRQRFDETVQEMKDEQSRMNKILEAWQESDTKRKWEQERRDRFNRLMYGAVGVISLLLSILVAVNTLAGGVIAP